MDLAFVFHFIVYLEEIAFLRLFNELISPTVCTAEKCWLYKKTSAEMVSYLCNMQQCKGKSDNSSEMRTGLTIIAISVNHLAACSSKIKTLFI